ncbi:unnamed protein product [Cladocopium goreaui]|uniref:Uncharacterized protein n=1 Tax=Cladocopium goreaui TaxID=2562237 RepID=A0A9P1BIB5_9DINO|nr:unnamed protein product [Cladocopium goreaui]|mmetsp:Transcript_68614/g.151037  ORF Transcript_68614/g.151037 Transcript_68614/m.151037 type:complete len:432 (-) Transcript_68614:286-1581(-)
MPERPQSVDSSLGGSKRWSCGTLEEGIEHVQGAAHNKSKSLEEEQLLRELQELDLQEKELNGTPAAGEKDPSELETLPATEEELCAATLGEDQTGVGAPVATPVRKRDEHSGEPPSKAAKTEPATLTPVTPASQGSPQTGNAPESPPTPEIEPRDGKRPAWLQGLTIRQFNARRAAKARIDRMVKPHSRRRELDPPSWLVEEWRKGDKNSMADLYSSVNFDKERFLNELHILVKKKQTFKLTVDQGWFSEQEMKDELSWSQSKINGAKSRCLQMAETHVRNNAYDGVQEFWIIVKERARSTEESSYEELQHQVSKAAAAPTCQFDKKFEGLSGNSARTQKEQQSTAEITQHDKYMQTKERLTKFLESIMNKSGKLRSLIRELSTKYSDAAAASCVTSLEAEIKKIDQQYDICNEAMAQGELDGFTRWRRTG